MVCMNNSSISRCVFGHLSAQRRFDPGVVYKLAIYLTLVGNFHRTTEFELAEDKAKAKTTMFEQFGTSGSIKRNLVVHVL